MTTKLETITTEPSAGSIVLLEGESGTAWQRFFSDGLWHSTTGRVAPFSVLLQRTQRPGALPILLVHAGPPDEPVEDEQLALFDLDGEPTAQALGA